MDVIYMNSAKEDVGVLQNYELDLAYGEDENNLECRVPAKHHCCQAGWGLYVEGTEYGGIIDSIKSDTANDEVTYYGRTWHGLLASRVILPLQIGEASTGQVTVQTTTDAGKSLVGRYLIISGDANACIRYIINRVGLSDLFTTPSANAGVNIEAFQFSRYTDAYKGLCKMLESAGLKMNMAYADGKVTVSAVKQYNFAHESEFDSSFQFEVKKNYHTVNHLICLGSGEMENRMVVHLYADYYGNISTTQSIFGLDEYVATYDYSGVESEEELIRGGKERLKELWVQDELSIDFDKEQTTYDIGDIVGAVESITGISVSAPIIKKIVTIKNGKISIDLTTGEGVNLTDYIGTYRLYINNNGHLICSFSGSVPPPLRINENGHLVYTYHTERPGLFIDEEGHLILTDDMNTGGDDNTGGGGNTGDGGNTGGGGNTGDGDNTGGGGNTGDGDNTGGGGNTGDGDNTGGGNTDEDDSQTDFIGTYSLYINDNGHLICAYPGSTPPDFQINDEGHLIFTYDQVEPALHINDYGHLIQTI